MKTIVSEINNSVNPALKEEYKKYTGFEPEDGLVKYYIRLGARQKSLTMDEMLQLPKKDLVLVVEKYIKQDVICLSYRY